MILATDIANALAERTLKLGAIAAPLFRKPQPVESPTQQQIIDEAEAIYQRGKRKLLSLRKS